MLTVLNNKIEINGKPIQLRGVCLGGWLNMENFIVGYVGCESKFRKSIHDVLGSETADYFFEKFLDNFITEQDIEFIASLGANVVRVPFNYHHFEDDEHPFEFKESGFKYLDKLISWCKAYNIYVILDLHSAPGWQNPDWHCDNPSDKTMLWSHPHFQDRVIALWGFIAKHYRYEKQVAGYDLLNEPVVEDIQSLNKFYTKTIQEIRSLDSKHIIFIEGNHYSSNLMGIDCICSNNIALSSHHYINQAVMTHHYLKDIKASEYNRNAIADAYHKKNQPIYEANLPCWIGEFGLIFEDNEYDAVRLQITKDLLEIMNNKKDHWTLWTYKDIEWMGPLFLDPQSPWMLRTAPIRHKKTELLADTWPITKGHIDSFINELKLNFKHTLLDYKIDESTLGWQTNRAIRGLLISRLLIPLFAEQFRGMNLYEIDEMMQSFRFKKCVQRDAFVGLLRGQLKI